MTVLDRQHASPGDSFPGIDRWTYVNGDMGADSLSVMELNMSEGSEVPTHTHPTEEAMVVLDGRLEALVGERVVTVEPGQTILARPGVKHGLVNKSCEPAKLMAIFPTARVVRNPAD